MTRLGASLVAVSTAICAPLAGAHHSYAGYDPAERYVFSGTVTEIQWGNPHILLFVSDGAQTLKLEWMTLNGAEVTGVAREQFSVGERITVTGSRNRNPEIAIITIIKQIDLPDDGWTWKRP